MVVSSENVICLLQYGICVVDFKSIRFDSFDVI